MRDQAHHVTSLLRHGCSILAKDSVGRNIMHYAATTQSDNVLTCMLDAWSSPYWHGNDSRGTKMLDLGQLVNNGDSSGSTALLVALQKGHIRKAKLLLKLGADPDIANHTGMTPREWSQINCVADQIWHFQQDSKEETLSLYSDWPETALPLRETDMTYESDTGS